MKLLLTITHFSILVGMTIVLDGNIVEVGGWWSGGGGIRELNDSLNVSNINKDAFFSSVECLTEQTC